MSQFPGNYPFHSRGLGSDFISCIQEISPGLWFNAHVPMNGTGVTIKYGVTTVDSLCSDLLNWNTLYLAGRMHQHIRIIKDDLPEKFTEPAFQKHSRDELRWRYLNALACQEK